MVENEAGLQPAQEDRNANPALCPHAVPVVPNGSAFIPRRKIKWEPKTR